MGKDLKGRELGECISQLENKKYQGRITTKNGKRIKRSFDTLAECRKWVNDIIKNSARSENGIFEKI